MLQAQKEISGVVNVYRKVTEIVSSNSVRLLSADSVAIGDTILLFQMQGFGVTYTDPPQFYGGVIEGWFGNPGGPGRYEFLLVGNISGDVVTFTRDMANVYDVLGNLQLIVVPSYYSARVKGKLTARSWNRTSGVGGVLAIIVGSTLELDNLTGEIDVSGKGFIGGKDTIGIGDCIENNFSANTRYSYPRTWTNAGYKGEGVANFVDEDPSEFLESWVALFPGHSKGQGPAFTGGGGGNGRYSGGGGGANRGKGQDGGTEVAGVCPQNPGGYSGKIDSNPNGIYIDGVYMGGGGGSSTHAPGEQSSDGGNGGGIVIILADEIIGNGRSVISNGLSANNVSGNGGGGGGGAGGSILLSAKTISGSSGSGLSLIAKGGNGGYRAASWGSGGSGGGGLISLSQSQAGLPSYVSSNVDPGIVVPGAAQGVGARATIGAVTYNLIPKVNGFLFNTIWSDSSGTQLDTICSDTDFGVILGTSPVGGTPGYTISWEKSTVSRTGPWTPVSGVTSQNYSPGRVTQKTWFRRIITDSSVPVITDESIPVEVNVQTAITGNEISADTTICFGQDPLALTQMPDKTLQNGNGKFSFRWEESMTGTGWSPADGQGQLARDFDPDTLRHDRYFRRFVKSGYCESTSDPVLVTVLPLISGNAIFNYEDQSLCQPGTFDNLNGSVATGGAGPLSYTYTWLESPDNVSWQIASESMPDSLNVPYDPSEPLTPEIVTRFFRRMVISGPYGTCSDTTLAVKLIQYPKITNNYITDQAGTVINGHKCQDGSSQLSLNGTMPVGGNGTFSFKWMTSLNMKDWTPTTGTQQNYTGPAPSDFFNMTRVVTDGSGKCFDTTHTKKLNGNPVNIVQVFRIPVANAGSDKDICGATTGLLATLSVGGDSGTGWLFSLNGSDIKQASDPLNRSASVKVDSSFFGSSAFRDMSFYWREVNGSCSDTASVKVAFYTRVPELGPDRDSSFYSFDGILHMDAQPLITQRGETGLWTALSGSAGFEDPTVYNTTVNNLDLGLNSYRWTVSNKNGSGVAICSDTYKYDVHVYDVFVPNGFSPNSDGLYDIFSISGLDLGNQQATLRILNGAGTEVFHTTNVGDNGEARNELWTEWDGRSLKGAELPEGTYYYLLDLKSNGNGQVYKKSGFVILKRY